MKANAGKSANSMNNDASKKYQHKCSHCGGHKHHGGDDKHWELVLNAAFQPDGWNSYKEE